MKLSLTKRKLLVGWLFILPAVILLVVFSFYPIYKAFSLSLMHGPVRKLEWYGINNYLRIFKDKIFIQTLKNTFIYTIFSVPIMLVLGMILASVLNSKTMKLKPIFRTMLFIPCATSLVSYSIVFRSLFSNDGFINVVLNLIGLPQIGWLQSDGTARLVIIIALIWRWTGYYMVFYLASLQNIDYEIYEAARIDGASSRQIFTGITIPLLRPTIVFTSIMAINNTLQLFDESMNLTNGGPGNATMSMSHYIYNLCFVQNPNFSYASALSIVILIMVAILSMIQMKVGDKRD